MDIFGSKKDFFHKRIKVDSSPLIVEAINEKGAQARASLKEKGPQMISLFLV